VGRGVADASARAGGTLTTASLFQAVETQYYGQLEPFLVANTVYSELAAAWWREQLADAPFRTDSSRLASSRELWNLLTLRLELEVALQDRLDGMDRLAVEVSELLEAELGSAVF